MFSLFPRTVKEGNFATKLWTICIYSNDSQQIPLQVDILYICLF